jgi:hypothetical protein
MPATLPIMLGRGHGPGTWALTAELIVTMHSFPEARLLWVGVSKDGCSDMRSGMWERNVSRTYRDEANLDFHCNIGHRSFALFATPLGLHPAIAD